VALISQRLHWRDPESGQLRAVEPALWTLDNGWRLEGGPVKTRIVRSGTAWALEFYHQRDDKQWKSISFTIPAPSYDRGLSFSFPHEKLTWKLILTDTGFDLTADVPARLGSQTYSFPQVSRLLDLKVHQDTGDLDGDGFRLTRAVMVRADRNWTPCSAWTIKGGNISFTCDDSDFPAEAFPYVIDPTGSFYPTVSEDDAWARGGLYGTYGCPAWPGALTTSWTWGGPTATTNQTYSSSAYYSLQCWKYSHQSYIRFDTSSIPSGSTVSSASVSVYASSVRDENQGYFGGAGCSVQADWYASSNWPITWNEWSLWGSGNAMAPQDLTGKGVGWHSFPLANLANIPTGGGAYAGLKWSVPCDPFVLASGSLYNEFTFYSFDNGPSTKPYLSITYSEPAVQHVITSSPVGRSLTVDGAPCTAPCTFQWTAGTQHTIATTTPQAGGTGTQYVFANWSDGGAMSHSITASSSPATYTANFTTQYYLTTAASPPAGGTISPASSWRNSGSVVSVSATANTGYTFTGFTGALTGTTTPQNLTMNGPKTVTANFAVSNQPPQAVSVTPSSGSGLGPQTFQFLYSDPNGFADLASLYGRFNATASDVTACSFRYDRASNYIYLYNDAGTGWAGSGTLGTQLTNSQCTLGAGSTTPSGNNLTLNLTITFKTAFAGAKNTYMQALDAASASSGWQTRGTWTVPAGVQHTITTSPAGLSLTVDGSPCTAPCTFQWTPGSNHTIATTSPQAGGSGTQYVFSNWSDGGAISHTITASSSPATYTANFTTQYTTIAALNTCISTAPSGGSCTLALGTYTVTETILINRSGVTVTGGGSARTQTKLVRDPSFTQPLIRINAPSFTAPGIALQDLTVCGGLDVIRDIHTQSDVNLGASPVGCPRQQTTPGFTSGSCGDMLRRITVSKEPGAPPPPPCGVPPLPPCDFQCTDIEVQRADTGDYQANPFPSTSRYSLTIANVDLEDSAGHALSLFEAGTPGSHINDIYIHDSAINGSAVTGILYGNNIAKYHAQVCDTNPNWLNDQTVFAPRNLRIENNTFANNHTGAMGGGPVRWVGLRNNTFTNNYIHPQVGNEEGGTIEFDPCADKFEITGNQFYAPSVYAYNTDGLELYSRNLFIQGNTISGYPLEGIALNSVFGATVTGNVIANNATQWDRTGGIAVSTTESITGPCGDPRESRDVTISNNTVTGQLYGVYLSGHDLHSTATLRRFANPFAVALAGSDLTDQVGRGGIVVLDSYSGPTASVVPEDYFFPRTLTVRAVSPVTSRCSTGSQPQTFAFPASHPDGGSHIRLIEVVFSISGDDEDGKNGPDNGAGGCHFAYLPHENPPVVYLDGPPWLGTWTAGSSVVGPGGIDLNNGYCTIHAGWTPAPMTEPYISPFITPGLLMIEFPPGSSKKHIYTVVQDYHGRVSDGGTWKYWGWWATQ